MSTLAALAALPAAAIVVWILLRSPSAGASSRSPRPTAGASAPRRCSAGSGSSPASARASGSAVAVGASSPDKRKLGIYGGIALIFVVGLVDDLCIFLPS